MAAVVAVADGVALHRDQRTMSDEFHDHLGPAVFVMGGTVAHLLLHNRLKGAAPR